MRNSGRKEPEGAPLLHGRWQGVLRSRSYGTEVPARLLYWRERFTQGFAQTYAQPVGNCDRNACRIRLRHPERFPTKELGRRRHTLCLGILYFLLAVPRHRLPQAKIHRVTEAAEKGRNSPEIDRLGPGVFPVHAVQSQGFQDIENRSSKDERPYSDVRIALLQGTAGSWTHQGNQGRADYPDNLCRNWKGSVQQGSPLP